MVLKCLALSVMLLTSTGASAQSAAADLPSSQQDMQRQCKEEADRNKMNVAEQDTFIRECVAGKKLDHPSPEQSPPAARQ